MAVAATATSQEVILPLSGNPEAARYHRHRNESAFRKSSLADTLDLPFFDDFSDSHIAPDNTRWSDRQAFVNNNYCIDPVTMGVATMDAVDEKGSIYANATLDPQTFEADHLTSHPIRLGLTPSDSVYLSFLIQPGGLGHMPREHDSLLLDFFIPSDTAWVNVWASPGYESIGFRQVMVPVTDTLFLQDGFRFRFRNLASLPRNNDYPDKRSNVDHWNIDYVRLDRNRFAGDTIMRDVAFTGPVQSVLENLSSLPWSHYEDARLTALDTRFPVRYRNNDSVARNVTRDLLIEEPLWGDSFSPSEPSAQDLPAGLDTVVEFDYFYPIDFKRGASALVRFTASLRTDEFDPKMNDTVVFDQVLKDYYSYDDGSAEAGYGLNGQGSANGSVAVRYHSYTADEITGVDICFNQLYDSVNLGYYFKLMVWSDLDGKPGPVLHEDANDLTPEYADVPGGFVTYYFSEPVPVDGDFHVGWKQYNRYLMNVGLDKNSFPEDTVVFYNLDGSWKKSTAPGVLMLRPFFYRQPSAPEKQAPVSHHLQLYPNPASDVVRIRFPEPDFSGFPVYLEILDPSGRTFNSETLTSDWFNVSHLQAGLYFIRLRSGNSYFHSKLLIRHR